MWRGSCLRCRLLLSLGAASLFTQPFPAVPPCFPYIPLTNMFLTHAPFIMFRVLFFTYLSDSNRSTDWGHYYCANISNMLKCFWWQKLLFLWVEESEDEFIRRPIQACLFISMRPPHNKQKHQRKGLCKAFFPLLVSPHKSHGCISGFGLHGLDFTFGITLLTFLRWSSVTVDILQNYWQCLISIWKS